MGKGDLILEGVYALEIDHGNFYDPLMRRRRSTSTAFRCSQVPTAEEVRTFIRTLDLAPPVGNWMIRTNGCERVQVRPEPQVGGP